MVGLALGCLNLKFSHQETFIIWKCMFRFILSSSYSSFHLFYFLFFFFVHHHHLLRFSYFCFAIRFHECMHGVLQNESENKTTTKKIEQRMKLIKFVFVCGVLSRRFQFGGSKRLMPFTEHIFFCRLHWIVATFLSSHEKLFFEKNWFHGKKFSGDYFSEIS